MSTQKFNHGGNWNVRHSETHNAAINLNTESGASFVIRKLDEIVRIKEELKRLREKKRRGRPRKSGPSEDK